MPGAEWFPGARLNYAEHVLRPRADGDVAIRHASELRAARRGDAGRAAGARWRGSRLACGRSASGRATGSSRTCRTSRRRSTAFLACASIGAIWSSCSPDFGARSVIDRFAQITPKVLLAVDGYRYGGKDFDRIAGRGAAARVAADGRAHGRARLPRPGPVLSRASAMRLAGRSCCRLGRGGAAHVRAGAVRSSALGALQLGHDRVAEGDRARPRRDPGRDAEEDAPARRPACRRPAVLVHDDGLDDVELRRLGADERGVGRALRRQPGLRPTSSVLWDLAAEAGVTCFGTSRGLHRELPEGRHPRLGGPRPLPAALGRLDRVAALAGGVRVGVRVDPRGHLAVLDLGRHRRRHRLRRRRPDAARLPGRAAGALARGQARSRGARRGSR